MAASGDKTAGRGGANSTAASTRSGSPGALHRAGRISTPAGRCLAFPTSTSTVPVRSASPTPPARDTARVVAFFLVDPSETLDSTSDVPPQQPWSAASTMTLDHARAYREQLVQEAGPEPRSPCPPVGVPRRRPGG
ncbi:DUF4246 family protein [Streptomyces sp. NPDC055912]|uniref:DUF4246 family protein n=1 Tax=Streptomyces sp. NPDC055912 TaxID=3345660 RepID=UPI0035E11D62